MKVKMRHCFSRCPLQTWGFIWPLPPAQLFPSLLIWSRSSLQSRPHEEDVQVKSRGVVPIMLDNSMRAPVCSCQTESWCVKGFESFFSRHTNIVFSWTRVTCQDVNNSLLHSSQLSLCCHELLVLQLRAYFWIQTSPVCFSFIANMLTCLWPGWIMKSRLFIFWFV